MKTKYMINGGLAFTEKKDLKKLEKHASEGWLLKGFAFGGFMYKLAEGQKQELTYSMDFQSNPNNEYLDIFSTAGWRHITSYKKQVHIFSAPKGTSPIYSENEIAEGKYKDLTSQLGKWSLYSFVALMVSSLTMMMSKSYFEILYYPLYFICMISLISFVFCFMPYTMYKIKENNNKN